MLAFRIHVVVTLIVIGGWFGPVWGDATTREDSSSKPVTTKPTVSEFEIQLVFPGSISQGQIRARIRPGRGCELLALQAQDGTAIAALFGRGVKRGQTGTTPALLYFYGNGMCMADSLPVFNRLRGLGFDVIMADYEGYGMSDGTPSEQGCYAAADAAYDYLLKRSDVDRDRIVVTGWSLGAAVAIDLASRRRVAGLATFSAFTNISDMGATMTKGLPLAALLLSSRFDNLQKIGSVTCPIFMAHGLDDTLVPPEMLDRLSRAAKSKVTVVRVEEAGHNDIFERGGSSLFNRLKVFVDGLPAVAPTTMPAVGR
jgi:pimeloyl-ACP methyl ester carboxylesterase